VAGGQLLTSVFWSPDNITQTRVVYPRLVLGLAAVGAWLYFCSAYTGRTYHRNPTYRRLAIAVYIALVAVKVTNPSTANTSQQQSSLPRSSSIRIYGATTLTAMGLSYALAFVGYFMLLELFTQIDLDTRALFLPRWDHWPSRRVDLCWVHHALPHRHHLRAAGVAVFAVGVAFVYIDQFEAVQLAAERDTPVIALDVDNYIRDTNRAALTLFPRSTVQRVLIWRRHSRKWPTALTAIIRF